MSANKPFTGTWFCLPELCLKSLPTLAVVACEDGYIPRTAGPVEAFHGFLLSLIFNCKT